MIIYYSFENKIKFPYFFLPKAFGFSVLLACMCITENETPFVIELKCHKNLIG